MPYKDPEKQREYMRNWIANRRAEFFKDKVCERCGSKEYLELDHKDRTQKVTHRIWSWSKDRREAELSKCQVLCHDCHLTKTLLEDERPRRQHGTRSCYLAGCKRDECRKAHRDYRRKRRAAGFRS